MAFVDNKKVGGNHQRGIERIKQKGAVEKTWQSGCMENGMKHQKDGFKRSSGSLTPRKA